MDGGIILARNYVNAASKVFDDATKSATFTQHFYTVFKEKSEEWLSILKSNYRGLRDLLKGVKGARKFTIQQIDDYVALATKQGNRLKVMLGKTDAGGLTGYVSRAGDDHAYFKMNDSQWDEALSIVGNDFDEMWQVNKKFIDNRKALGNEFYLSHNPAIADGFYLREINYLTKPISEGGLGGSIVDLGNSLWKIVW